MLVLLLVSRIWAQEAAVAPAIPGWDDGTVLVEGLPAAPVATIEDIGRYNEVRSASLASLAPDGARMLVTTRFGSTGQVHLVSSPLGMREQLTFRSEPVAQAALAPDGANTVIFKADVGGNEQWQLYRMDLDTKAVSLLTDGTSRHEDWSWSRDASRIAWNSNARNGKDMDIYVRDLAGGGAAKRVLDVSGAWSPGAWSASGTKLILQEYISRNEARLHLLDVQTGVATAITPGPAAAWGAAQWGADDATIFAISDQGADVRRIWSYDLADGVWAPVGPESKWDVESLIVADDGRTAAMVVNEDGWGVLHLLDLAKGKDRVVTSIPKGVVGGVAFTDDGRKLAATVSMPTAGADVWMIDVKKGTSVRWTRSEVGPLDASRLATPEIVRVKSFDGLEVSAFLYTPPGPGPHPVVVSIHGGPEGQARPYYSALTQYLLAERGYAVLVPNVRGSDGYGRTFLSLDDGPKREDSVRDIGAFLDWISAQPTLDAKKVAVFGGSYGGYMVLASLVHFPERLRAGVDVVGIANFVTFLENTSPYRQDLRRVEYGDERDPQMRALLEKFSPVHRAGEIRSDLFVAHGANDPRVPVDEAEQIVAAARAAGNDAWYFLARNEGHGFNRKENRDLFNALVVAFLEQSFAGE